MVKMMHFLLYHHFKNIGMVTHNCDPITQYNEVKDNFKFKISHGYVVSFRLAWTV